MLKRLAEIEAELATIQKDGVIIKKYCSATPDEVQAAMRSYEQKLRDAEALVLAMEIGIMRARADLRRVSS